MKKQKPKYKTEILLRTHTGGRTCYDCCGGPGTGAQNRICPGCRKVMEEPSHCGYETIFVGPRIEVPGPSKRGRWKEFLKRFPRIANALAQAEEMTK